MQLGARGTSVLFASGDGGVTGSQFNPLCNIDANLLAFVPTFPSGCPLYVTTSRIYPFPLTYASCSLTSVGSTKGVSPETASVFSSGGFSNYFSAPPYQSSAVSAYQRSLGGILQKGKYNSSGRGYPDVSAQGENFTIYYQGEQTGVSGTSASSPVFASVIALLNDRLIAAGRSPLGFLNPFLYSAAVSQATYLLDKLLC
jgi:tripeptidyl-peptidase-1